MFKHKINYVDFNGNPRSEDFYFHLSVPEVTRLEAELGTSVAKHSKELAEAQDVKSLIGFIERVVLSAYGKKTSDGKTFQKSPELRKEFEYSQAYAELFEELLTNPDLATRFGEAVADNGKTKKNQVAPSVVSE